MADGLGLVQAIEPDQTQVRPGDLLFYAGPEQMQRVTEAIGARWAHVGVIVQRDARFSVVEVGLKGVQVRSMDAVLRHYGVAGVGRLPVSDELASELADRATHRIGQDAQYGAELATLQYCWQLLRSVESDWTPAITRWSLPVMSGAAWWTGRRARTTCSHFVHQLLVETNLDACLDLCFDRALPAGPNAGWRWHQRLAGGLCTPGDLWCSGRLDTAIRHYEAVGSAVGSRGSRGTRAGSTAAKSA